MTVNFTTKILREAEVRNRTGLSSPSIWRGERARTFPRRFQIGRNAVGWLEHEIDEWIAGRAAQREKPAAA